MNLYLVHCGYYAQLSNEDIYECHTNLLTIAEDLPEAIKKTKANPEFLRSKMHIDGVLKISKVDGYRLNFEFEVDAANSATEVERYGFHEIKGL